MRSFRGLLLGALVGFSSLVANAGVITTLYGDKDMTGTYTGGVGITDVDLGGASSRSWTQTFAAGPLLSGSVSIGHSADGFMGPGAVLKLDGVTIGSLTDLDNCGGAGDPGRGCDYIGSLYTVDTFNLTPYLSLLKDGVAVFTITLNTSGDSWALDFSELKLTTGSVPEPGTVSLLGLALAGLWVGAKRKRAA